jgi:D-sedoheptulose 7-phosphate isomerase
MISPDQDPRHRNTFFDTSSIASYRDGYAAALKAALDSVPESALDRLVARLSEAANQRSQIFSIGNGGSSAIAEHLCCDWSKGTFSSGHPPISSHSLTSNNAVYSAIANDFGFDQVFAGQLQLFASAGDLLIAVSSSGNSHNIIAAADKAHELGLEVIGLTGFSGGRLKDVADIPIHIAVDNYGIVEDAHQALIHVIAQFIACERDRRPNG